MHKKTTAMHDKSTPCTDVVCIGRFCRQLGLGAVSWETMAHGTGEGLAASTISMRQESDAGTAMASMVMSVSEHCGLPARRAAQARSVQNSSSARDAALYVGFPKRNMNALHLPRKIVQQW